MTAIRKAAVAGMFYPDDPRQLSSDVNSFLSAAGAFDGPAPKAIIAPHAGYRYSGAIAAKAYARLKPVADKITRVVLLGPCHRVAVRGLALSGADCFETPLGQVEIDKDAESQIAELEQVGVFELLCVKKGEWRGSMLAIVIPRTQGSVGANDHIAFFCNAFPVEMLNHCVWN